MTLDVLTLVVIGAVFLVIGIVTVYDLLCDRYFQPNPFVRHTRAEYWTAGLMVAVGVVVLLVSIV